MNLSDKVKQITTIVLDVDGVLTNGTLGFFGNDIMKTFNARDGHGIKLAMRAGLAVGFLSGRDDAMTSRRGEELNVNFMYLGEKDKGEALDRLLQEQGVTEAQCLYMGDDVIDIPVARRVGVSIAVADAVAELKSVVDKTTELKGGDGAVREVLDWVLKEQGKWDALMQRYLG
jgi:3-deoxy-D-manno-octulosonate 8-phosphate phosphatase (KDO 8-P phosphatase)